MLVTGVDIVEIHRVDRVVGLYGKRFLNRIYTGRELAYARGRAPQLASRFAAKEAVMKALGTGVRGVGWRDIEVVRESGGPPRICLYGSALDRFNSMGLDSMAVSLSHSQEYAGAFVVGV